MTRATSSLYEGMQAMKSFLRATAFLAGGVAATVGLSSEAWAQDIKRQKARVDFWGYHQENDDAADSKQQKLTIRAQQPLLLPSDWRLTLRADLPMINTDKAGPANPGGGSYAGHIGDVLTQVAIATPQVLPDLTFSTGIRLVYPTGDKSPFGSAQWKVAPQFGASYTIRGIGEGLNFSPLARYFHGFSPTRAGTTTSRSWDFYPEIGLNLADRWSILLWNENGISFNERTDKWFIPLDLQVLKGINEHFGVALGVATKIGGDDKSYKNMVYGRTFFYF
jgi:hypothetical protein